jgi:hypothetical protein
MKLTTALLGAGLAAASLAAPASAQDAGTSVVFTVTASDKGSVGGLEAGCVFTRDLLVQDYGPTYIDGYAETTIVGSVTVTCELFWEGTDRGYVSGNGAFVAVASGTGGFVGTSNVRACVSATATGVVDVGLSVSHCRNV